MNCFQLVKQVLDEMYKDFPEMSEREKDEIINKSIAYLERQYRGLATGSQIKYTHRALTFAYTFRYVTAHANVVYQIISESPALSRLFRQDRINIVCIGGGPGSDILGIIKHVLLSGNNSALDCTTLDKERRWRSCWNLFNKKLGPHPPTTNNFQYFDVSDNKTWPEARRIAQADLFTMNYFMSEIDSLRDAAESFFEYLISNAKAGALFLYIDNNNEQFYNWFDTIAYGNGLKLLSSNEGRMVISDINEEKKDLGEYYDKFGTPQLRPNVAFRIFRKR